MNMKKERKIWIVSTEPPMTSYGEGNLPNNEYIFKEEVDISKLNLMIMEFSESIDESLKGIEKSESNFQIDSIEINATMAVDGKLGILGSSVGAKAEGSLKFIFKRKNN